MTYRHHHRLQLALFSDEAFVATAVAPQPVLAAIVHSPRPPEPRGLSSADARRMVWLRTQGEPVAAISISGPTFRVTPDKVAALAQPVITAARDLSAELGFHGENIKTIAKVMRA